MATGQDRLNLDFNDRNTTAAPGASESPADLADSPTVNDPEAGVTPAVAARAALPDNPALGMVPDSPGDFATPRDLNPAGTLTGRVPGTDPGAPMAPGMGGIVGDVAGDRALRQSDIGDRLPGAETQELANHGGGMPGHPGTDAALDETSGSDDPSARAGRG